MTGTDDRIARPDYGRRLAAAIPGSAYLELEHGGHAVPIEPAALINRLLAEHMAEATQNAAS